MAQLSIYLLTDHVIESLATPSMVVHIAIKMDRVAVSNFAHITKNKIEN